MEGKAGEMEDFRSDAPFVRAFVRRHRRALRDDRIPSQNKKMEIPDFDTVVCVSSGSGFVRACGTKLLEQEKNEIGFLKKEGFSYLLLTAAFYALLFLARAFGTACFR